MNKFSRCALAAACASVLAAAPVIADEQGDLWETTAQASVPGMPVNMPPYKAKVCKKKDWTIPPQTTQDPNQNCKPTDFNHTGNTITWKMSCDNPPMTGEGELTFNGTDTYEGQFTMHAQQFNMQMHLTGKKIGTCDNPE
jgi:hypothetical protein